MVLMVARIADTEVWRGADTIGATAWTIWYAYVRVSYISDVPWVTIASVASNADSV